jgi:hypothetical protein
VWGIDTSTGCARMRHYSRSKPASAATSRSDVGAIFIFHSITYFLFIFHIHIKYSYFIQHLVIACASYNLYDTSRFIRERMRRAEDTRGRNSRIMRHSRLYLSVLNLHTLGDERRLSNRSNHASTTDPAPEAATAASCCSRWCRTSVSPM